VRSLSNNLLNQLYLQESNDPFLTLITLEHSSFTTVRLVNNVENITSRGDVFDAFPVKITLPTDDGETLRQVALEFDNVSLELIEEIRSVTDLIDVKIEMVLASTPDIVEIDFSELKIKNITYNKTTIIANLFMDDFLNTELTSEKYTPTNFPGLFS